MKSLDVMRRRGRRRLNRGTVVLLYHRVAELESDPQLLAVSPRHFAEHLALLREQYEPLALVDLVKAVQGGAVPPRGVVITFDDGYEDNLLVAKPLLEAAAVPATVFVASGYVSVREEFVWEELERVLLQPGQLPPVLKIDVGCEALSLELGNVALYARDEYERHRWWTVLDDEDPTPRHAIYRSLHARLRTAASAERSNVLGQLRMQANSEATPRPSHRPLTATNLRHLTEGGLIEVGAHSVTHPVLSTLSPEEQYDEIAGSKRDLEEALRSPVASFSYPYGSRDDFTSTTVSITREAGFDCACANFPGQVTPASNLFEIPRVLVRDWDAEGLLAHMEASSVR